MPTLNAFPVTVNDEAVIEVPTSPPVMVSPALRT
jgi:hypothetical protein